MARKLAALAALLFAGGICAQTVPDFTATDGNGKSYTLYTLLAQGKHVIIWETSPS